MVPRCNDPKESKTDQAKQLLAQYGSAYLITSISFAAVSFAACYFAVTAGACVCVGGGDQRVGRRGACYFAVTAGRGPKNRRHWGKGGPEGRQGHWAEGY